MKHNPEDVERLKEPIKGEAGLAIALFNLGGGCWEEEVLYSRLDVTLSCNELVKKHEGAIKEAKNFKEKKLKEWDLEEAKKKYIQTGGRSCLICGSYDISLVKMVIPYPFGASQEIRCNKCSSTWTDVYILSQVKDVSGLKE